MATCFQCDLRFVQRQRVLFFQGEVSGEQPGHRGQGAGCPGSAGGQVACRVGQRGQPAGDVGQGGVQRLVLGGQICFSN